MKLLHLLFTISFVWCFEDDPFLGFEEEPPIVEIADGSVRGGWEESTNGRKYAIFEGIPFAKPPVGELRFKAPQPPVPWKGIFNASGSQENCLQYDPFFEQVSGSEDCLFINVYTPHLKPTVELPVMVFVHGGAFMYGAGFHYDPVHLMDWDMVVVSFNYRVGPLGFLSTGDEAAPGNAGLKDQAFALHWVQKNIKAFGGDPDSVTVTGSSAGAASVHYLYLSPLANGTFSRGIAWSGSALVPWAYTTKPIEKTRRLAELVGCPTNPEDMANCLISKPSEDIVNVTSLMFDWKMHMFSPFAPTAEPPLEGAFLTQHPYEATRSGAMYDAPLIATVVSEEGLYPAAVYQKNPDEILPEIEDNWEFLAREIFMFNDTLPEDLKATVAAKIKEFYLLGKPVSQETFPQLVQAMGDRLFVTGTAKMAELHATNSKQPVFMYKYCFRGERSFTYAVTWNYKNFGVSHVDDIFHIFSVPLVTSSAPEDMKMTAALINMIYSFAKDSTPILSPEAPEWLPLVPGQPALNYMEISSPTSYLMKSNEDFGHRAFWDSLGFNEDQNYKKEL
ncbi:venom carboxylesterase-6-like [Pectinophora gossypiella]|uniref:venom carboxylesterase-6-like n=1 Tax=Pectinophora gossypiella TaxID=13191 RepID=UPI00214F310B|nr:venom carboxylesterase-6-like [Pectinophora gossypiella]